MDAEVEAIKVEAKEVGRLETLQHCVQRTLMGTSRTSGGIREWNEKIMLDALFEMISTEQTSGL